ncbi:MAG: pyridoxal phosphate-dependent class II aminotransferase [Bacteroides sp.]|nr:pyridoxal phosphate-dependent class II aminotransferase [Bacteroides sp.]
MIDGHGDDIFRYGNKVKVNFSTNIHQNVDHSSLMRHLASCPTLLSNYPEPEPRSVETMLADRHGVSSDNIIVTNGATEAIYLIAREHQGKKSAIVVPTFREYQDACKIFNHQIDFLTEQEFIEKKAIDANPDIIWLCNPNNPTGLVYDRGKLLELIDAMPSTLFVIDQAYADYSMAKVLNESDVLSRHNILMLQSLTKQFAIPGLRIGYAIGPKSILDSLRSMRMPWAVNSFAIESARYLLDNATDYVIDRESLHREALRIRDALCQLGISCRQTDCNFLLCELPNGKAASLKDWLINNHGLLIRDASNFETLGQHHFRIAAQEPENNDLLIKCIEEWISL